MKWKRQDGGTKGHGWRQNGDENRNQTEEYEVGRADEEGRWRHVSPFWKTTKYSGICMNWRKS